MKKLIFPKLAISGIRKNRRLYLPYLLTCVGMVMMYYIIHSLVYCPLLEKMTGGDATRLILQLGAWVIAVFAVIFLFYTNSFLLRRRKKEFGLYHILGMDKRSIARVLVWESVFTAAIGLAGGLLLGIAFSKFAELGLLNALHTEVDYSFRVYAKTAGNTLGVFTVIFLLLLLRSVWQVRRQNALELLHSENFGERPPKGNILLAASGMFLLGAAYWLAVTIGNPLSVLVIFFIAVVMVIIATYLLFVAGSVVFCRLLKQNRRYYYKARHFVSVSSMIYRMKRNGAGLASICILSTMVLVMVSSTASLYIGAEDSIRRIYPRDILAEVKLNLQEKETQAEELAVFRKKIGQIVSRYQTEPENILDYRFASISGLLQDGVLTVDVKTLTTFRLYDYEDVCTAYIVPLAEYNRQMGTQETLMKGEALLYCVRMDARLADDFVPTIRIANAPELRIKKVLDEFMDNSESAELFVPAFFLVVPNLEEYVEPLLGLADYRGDPMLVAKWEYGFDVDIPEKEQMELRLELMKMFREHSKSENTGKFSYSLYSVARQREDFYSLYGGLLFIGIMLSMVFIFAAVLIIYYKQISEGYEDRARFEIMQKVGMTKREIRQSVNSQVLTVFFLPLVFAGLHMAFAASPVWKMLQLFNLRNFPLFVTVTVCVFFVFVFFYGVVYKVTSNAYFAIVSGGEKG